MHVVDLKGALARCAAVLVCIALISGMSPVAASADDEQHQIDPIEDAATAITAGGQDDEETSASDNMLYLEDDEADDEAEDPIDDESENADAEQISVLALLDSTAKAGLKSTAAVPTARVSYTTQMYNMFGPLAPQSDIKVSGDTAERYGFSDQVADGVSVLDVLVDAHIRAFGEEFTADTASAYLACAESGFVTTIFCVESSANGFIYNGSYPGGTNGTTVTTQPVYDGDTIDFFLYQDTQYWSDYITWFCKDGAYVSSITGNTEDKIDLTVKGYMYVGGYLFNDAASLHGAGEPIEDARLGWVDIASGAIDEIPGITAAEDGSVSILPPAEEGTYHLTAFYNDRETEGICCPLIMTLLEVVIDASYTENKDMSALANLEVASFQSNPSALALTPAFSSSIFQYTAPEVAYEDISVFRSFYVRAAAVSPNAQITASLNGGDPVTLSSGSTMWTGFMMDKGLKPGSNKLVVSVSNGDETAEYTVSVAMFDPDAPVGPAPLEPVPPMTDIEQTIQAAGSYISYVASNPTFSSTGGEWAVIGQTRGDLDRASEYAAIYAENLAAELVRTNGEISKSTYTDYSRAILALTAAGYDVTDFAGYNLLKPLSDLDAVTKQGVNGPIWALIALDSHGYDIPSVESGAATQTTREGLIAKIVEAQLADGGWAIAGRTLDVDTTAMALIALAPYSDDLSTRATASSIARSAVERAISGLESLFADAGSNAVIASLGPDSYAQLITALISCGIDPAADARFGVGGISPVGKLLSFANEDGSFSRAAGTGADLRATEQSLLSLISYKRSVNGRAPLYDMSDIAIDKHQSAPALPEEPTVPTVPESPSGFPGAPGTGSRPGTAVITAGKTMSLFGSDTGSLMREDRTAGSGAVSALQDVMASASSAAAPADDASGLSAGVAGEAISPMALLGIVLIVVGIAGAACMFYALRRLGRPDVRR